MKGFHPPMKFIFSFCLATLVIGSLSAFGQAPAVPAHHSLNLQVEPVSTGSSMQNTAAAKSGGFGGRTAGGKDEITKTSASIAITVHNFAAAPDTAQVEWYFIATPAKLEPGKSAADQLFVFDKGSQSVTLPASGESKIPVTSKEVTSELKRAAVRSGYVRNNSAKGNNAPATGAPVAATPPPRGPQESGDKLSGWIVRVMADGKAIDVKASKDSLEELGKDDAKLTQMRKE